MTSPKPRHLTIGAQTARVEKGLTDLPKPQKSDAVMLRGRTGYRQGTEHLIFDDPVLAQIRGTQAIKTFERMELDGTVAGVLEQYRLLLASAPWTIEPGDEDDPRSIDFAERASEMIDGLDPGFNSVVAEAADALLWGFHEHEIVFEQFPDGFIGWCNFLAYDPRSLVQWNTHPRTGRLVSVMQRAKNGFPVNIEAWKLLHINPRPVSGRPEGRSLARNAFLAWSDKQELRRITKIGIRRDLSGLPKLEVPGALLGANPTDAEAAALAEAETMVREVERDIREGIVLPSEQNEDGKPSGWKFSLVQSAGRRSLDLAGLHTMLRQDIATSMLADVMLLGQDKVGSYALASSKTNTLARSAGAILDRVEETLRQRAMPTLQALNPEYLEVSPPVFRHGDIEETDLQELGDFVQKTVGAGAIVPDPAMDAALRRRAGLPEAHGQEEL